MSQPSQLIAARYHLRLSEAWCQWFDEDVQRLKLPGSFCTPVTTEKLLGAAPNEIWAGFMLPDTLPLVGNHYGDWICVRINANGRLGELLHWYHGGGDWIPLGSDLAEVVVHDVVDHFRPMSGQMLRGAPESLDARRRSGVLDAFSRPELRQWLCERLSASCVEPTARGDSVAQALAAIEQALSQGDYESALQNMHDRGWSLDAVACDQIQLELQSVPTNSSINLADPAIAESLKMRWSPDYVRWLFDVAQLPPVARDRITASVGAQPHDTWPEQDWKLAGELAFKVLARRQDLGWAINVAGWSRQRENDAVGAAEVYFRGRFASAFSDQAVRMRTHWTDAKFGKFTLAQLSELFGVLTSAQQSDPYLQAINIHSGESNIKRAQDYWMNKSFQQIAEGDYGSAYESVYRAGWDVGVDNLRDYESILRAMVDCASAVGWDSLQSVAQTHLNCFLRK